MNKLYFAYGSNCNLEQMSARCPDARVISKGKLKGWKLLFNTRRHPGGVANILKSEGREVLGLLWEISASDEKSLDRYEGYPSLYGKETVTIETEGGKSVEALVYIMTPGHEAPSIPLNSYFSTILRGFEENSIDTAPLYKALQETERLIEDAEEGR